MGAKTSPQMVQARAIIEAARRAGKATSFSAVARQVGLTPNAVAKDAECQRLMPGGAAPAMKPAMIAALALFEAGGISKREAAKRCGVSSGGLTLAVQRKQRENRDGKNG